jgi:hypothetical protein
MTSAHRDMDESARRHLLLGISFGLLMAPPLWLFLWFVVRLLIGLIGGWP